MPRKRGAGEGSISKRKDGLWHGRYTVKLADGTSKRKDIYRKTRREVADEINRVLTEIRRGTYIEPSKQTVKEYLESWLTQSIKPNIRDATYVSYSVVVHNHLIDGLGSTMLQELSPQHIEAYKLKKLEKMSARSVAYQLTILRAALDQAVKWAYVPRNVALLVDKPRVPRPKTGVLNAEDATKLLAALKGDRLEALYIVALALGLRRGELLGLHWSDLDPERGVLTIRSTLLRLNGKLVLQEPKTDKGRRTIKVPRFALRALLAHRDRQWIERGMVRHWQDNDLIFPSTRGTPIEPRNLNRHFGKVLERAGLGHIRLHDMRHSAASLMEAQGVSLKTLSTILGHSTIGITADLYVHPYDSTMQDAADRMDDLFPDTTPTK